ncbi:MAG: hypothetical protein ABI615_00455 [Chthoniobacterales bacterium]
MRSKANPWIVFEMKIGPLNILGAILFLTLSNGMTQEATPTPAPKNHLVFETGSKRPIAQQSTMKDPLDAAIDNFFLAIEAGQIDLAYERLVFGSIYAERAEDVITLKKKTAEALKAYGLVSAYELVEEKKVGDTLVRRTYLSRGEKLPLRWRFYYYKAKDTWKLVDFRVDDGLVELFDDLSRPAK